MSTWRSAEPVPESTQAAPPCHAGALDTAIGGCEAATGIRTAVLVVTNTSRTQPCQLQSTPDLHVIQSGSDLELTVSGLPAYREVQEPVQSDITLQPDQSAQAMLYGRG